MTNRNERYQDTLKPGGGTALTAILFYGGIWGLLEGSLGFALHLLPRVTPFPRLAGFVMFPLGLIFMVAAIQATRRPAGALAVAAVAAAVKGATLALPMVQFIFIRNPVMAILMEGTVVTLSAYLTNYLRVSSRSVLAAFGVGIGWRGLFLLANLTLGIQGGILGRPTASLLQFLLLEGAVNGVLILLFIAAGLFARLGRGNLHAAVARPLPAAAACTCAVAAQLAIVAV
jgi:hypothetical protein